MSWRSGLFAEIFRRNVHASGVVPQISLIVGPCAGGAVYSPAITDFTVMVDQTSHMFITGPDVIKTVTGEDVGFEELGGARTHNTTSGVAHHMAGDEKDAVEYVKALLSYLPSNNLSEPPAFPEEADLETSDEDRELDTLIPDSANQPYDMHSRHRARAGRRRIPGDPGRCSRRTSSPASGAIEGQSVGVVANQPLQFAGCLNIDASEKAARFVRTCDAYNVPVITFVDVPGFLPGTDQEYDGIIRRGAKLIYAYAEATVPLITVITRKAFGGAYDVMGSKHLGADLNFAWPTAQIAVMGAQGAVNILHRRRLAAVESDEEREELRGEAHAGVRGRAAQPVCRGRTRVCGRCDHAVRDPPPHHVGVCVRSAPSASSCRRRSTATSRCKEVVRDARTDDGENPPFPPIKVVRGNPTPEELAAALAVVRARAAAVASERSASRRRRASGRTRLVRSRAGAAARAQGLAHDVLAGLTPDPSRESALSARPHGPRAGRPAPGPATEPPRAGLPVRNEYAYSGARTRARAAWTHAVVRPAATSLRRRCARRWRCCAGCAGCCR